MAKNQVTEKHEKIIADYCLKFGITIEALKRAGALQIIDGQKK